MQKSITCARFRAWRITTHAAQQLLLSVGPFGEKFRGDVFPFAVREFSHAKADAAVFHHPEKDLLLLGRVFRPDKRFEIGPIKAPVTPEQR